MGEQLQKVSMKWSAATLQHEAQLLNAFAGLVEGRSQLSRVTMKIAWRLVRTVGILRVIEEFVQDKPCETAPDLVAQSLTNEFPSAVESPETLLGKKPPVRVQVKVGANRGREFRRQSTPSGGWGGPIGRKTTLLSEHNSSLFKHLHFNKSVRWAA